MVLDKQQILAISRLARLHLSDVEVDLLHVDLNDYLRWVEKLKEIDTEGVEPMASVVNQELFLRQDEVSDGDCAGDILGNAGEVKRVSGGGFFVVPKVVE